MIFNGIYDRKKRNWLDAEEVCYDIVTEYFDGHHQKCGNFHQNFRCNCGYFDRLFHQNACIWLPLHEKRQCCGRLFAMDFVKMSCCLLQFSLQLRENFKKVLTLRKMLQN